MPAHRQDRTDPHGPRRAGAVDGEGCARAGDSPLQDIGCDAVGEPRRRLVRRTHRLVTRNEMLAAFNAADACILAVVLVVGEFVHHPLYLPNPAPVFGPEPGFNDVSRAISAEAIKRAVRSSGPSFLGGRFSAAGVSLSNEQNARPANRRPGIVSVTPTTGIAYHHSKHHAARGHVRSVRGDAAMGVLGDEYTAHCATLDI